MFIHSFCVVAGPALPSPTVAVAPTAAGPTFQQTYC